MLAWERHHYMHAGLGIRPLHTGFGMRLWSGNEISFGMRLLHSGPGMRSLHAGFGMRLWSGNEITTYWLSNEPRNETLHAGLGMRTVLQWE